MAKAKSPKPKSPAVSPRSRTPRTPTGKRPGTPGKRPRTPGKRAGTPKGGNAPALAKPRINDEPKIKVVNPNEPQVFLIIRRKKLTHHMQFGESATFLDIKKEIEKCTQVAPEHQAIYYSMNGELMNDTLTLYQSGFPGVRHPPTDPVIFYVSFRQADGKFEHVEIAEYLRPPIEGPHVIEGPGASATTFPISDYAQKLLQQMAIKHDVRR